MIWKTLTYSAFCFGFLLISLNATGCMDRVNDNWWVADTGDEVEDTASDDTGTVDDTGTADTGDTGTDDTGDTGTDDTETTDDPDTAYTGPEYTDEPWGDWVLSSGNIDGCSGPVHYQKFVYEGAEATLVFLNGRTEYTDKYHHLFEMLDAPWNVVMYDHFGQGRSSGIRAHCNDFDQEFVCDLNEIIEQLVPSELPILVAAHSLGSYVAGRFAALYPGVAIGFILSSPMFGLNLGEGIPEETGAILAKSFVDLGRATDASYGAEARPECAENTVTHDCVFYDKYVDDPITMIGGPTYGWIDAFYNSREIAFSTIEDITDPVMMFQAEEDHNVLNEKQDEFCDAMNLLNAGACEMKVFEKKYHELFNETDRQLVVDAMVEYFQALLAE